MDTYTAVCIPRAPQPLLRESVSELRLNPMTATTTTTIPAIGIATTLCRAELS